MTVGVEELFEQEEKSQNVRTHEDVARAPIRGSGLLLFGRLISLGLNYVTQVVVVRYLTQADYGAWTYALSVVTLLQSMAALGLERAITRFVPIYHERRDDGKLIGTVLLAAGTVVVTGIVMSAGLYAFPDQIGRLMRDQDQPLTLLFIVIFLVPIEALDELLIGVFASLGRARAIFFRRHVVRPAFKLAAVLALVLSQSDVVFLAYGYLAASMIGFLIYGRLLMKVWNELGLMASLSKDRIVVPAREVLGFTAPLLTADLAAALMHSTGAIVLGYYHNLDQVAVFSAAVPLAALNVVVMRSFQLLYTPAASRLFARGEYSSINDLYWRTAAWLAILTFPIFAVTFSTAESLTIFLYGTRYQQAGLLLAFLAFGQYFNVALGFNGLTLRVLNKVKYVVTINTLAALGTVVLNILFVPRYGALGAAIATSAAMVLHNVLKQTGLRYAAGVSVFDRRYSALYLVMGLCAGALVVAQWLIPDRPVLVLCLAGVASLFSLQLCKRFLRVPEIFPEVLRVPYLRALFA